MTQESPKVFDTYRVTNVREDNLRQRLVLVSRMDPVGSLPTIPTPEETFDPMPKGPITTLHIISPYCLPYFPVVQLF